jgi:hypothetical protein
MTKVPLRKISSCEAPPKRSRAGLILHASSRVVLAAIIFKIILLAMNAVPFNGDEGVVALMARHILQGERPVFFYGQTYLGGTNAWLVAFSFSIFGQSILAIRIVQVALFAATLITTYHVARRFGFDEWSASIAVLLLALPPTMLTLYTTATLGGYGETLLLGNILLLIAYRVHSHHTADAVQVAPIADSTSPPQSAPVTKWSGVARHPLFRWLLLGIVAGFGFYTFPLFLIYLVPVTIWLLIQRQSSTWRGYAIGLIGFLIGAAPWWIALIQSGGVLINEMIGSAVAGSVGGSILNSIGVRLINFFLFGLSALFGLRYPWSADFVLPIVGVCVAVIYLAAFAYAIRRGSKILSHPKIAIMPWGMIAVLFLTFLLTPFGGDPSGRYFLPLYLPLAIFAAMLLARLREQHRTLVGLLIALILGYNVTGTLIAASIQPPGITTQFDPVSWIDHTRDRELIDFLLAHNETRGYTNYWVEYPIAFESNEQIITSAQLPYHLDLSYTPRDDRYLPYTQAVAQSPQAFYITVNHPKLDDLIRSGLARLNVVFDETTIGNYHIFYSLSRKVEPSELQLTP